MAESPDIITTIETAGKNLAYTAQLLSCRFLLYRKMRPLEVTLRLLKEKGLVSLKSDLPVIHDLLHAS